MNDQVNPEVVAKPVVIDPATGLPVPEVKEGDHKEIPAEGVFIQDKTDQGLV